MSSAKNKAAKLDPKMMGRRIRQLRGFELTQAQFAETLGVSQALLSYYEKGQRVPSLEFLLRLKSHSGRSIDWIITGDE
jgi:transcriptional regulator with XRE-family HTH domain